MIVGASLLKVRERLLTAATRTPVEPPAALAASLRDYQRHGLTWLAELTDLGLGACLADDMGLGKTVTLIALHLHRRESGRRGPTLVVCPASLLGNWEDEVRRFAPGVPVVRFHGGARDLSAAGDGFVLTTYGTMRRDAATLGGVGLGPGRRRRGPAREEPADRDRAGAALDRQRRPGGADRHARRERPHRAVGDPRLGDAGAARQPQRVPQGLGRRRSSPAASPARRGSSPT